jgi:two-component system, OmpR family, sensor kinase
VLATASTTSEIAPRRGWTRAISLGRRYLSTAGTAWTEAILFGRRHLLVVWTLWAAVCVVLMYLRPGQETIPYHLGWAGFALAFGLGTWSRGQLVAALGWYTVATGAILVRSWTLGDIGWEETNEIPLMFLLAMLMVWHVRRRQAALTDVTRLAEREVQACLDREQLMRLTSHELRTPLTIARGYIELLQTRSTELENQQDLLVVGDELERLSRVSDRLIRMIRLQDDTTSEMVDIDQVMAQAVERWQVVADRRWLLDAQAGCIEGSPERLRTGLDTLVENAIRYTSEGDTIRLVGARRLEHVVVGVFDTGVGLTDQQVISINACEQSPPLAARTGTAAGAETEAAAEQGTDADTADSLAGTGLGLSIVRALAHARGGTLHASQAPGGGASMILTFPLHSPASIGELAPHVEPDAMPTDWFAAGILGVPDVAKS